MDVLEISEESIRQIQEIAPTIPPTLPTKTISPSAKIQEERSLWQHQEEAVEKFMGVHTGILEMATGTGKTRTALEILTRLQSQNKIDSAIVTTDGVDLLSQWGDELNEWATKIGQDFLIYRHFGPYHELGDFALDPDNSILIISRGQLAKIFRQLPKSRRSQMLIIHDEIHGLGTPSLRTKLEGEHEHFGYRLGLSATPERAYDDEGNTFIAAAMGDTIYEFPIEAAIARGILCEFDYIPIEYELTDDDTARIQQVFAKQAARQKDGNPMSKEEVWIEISKVYKTAEMKPPTFREYLYDHPEVLENTIIFVETMEYGEKVLPLVHAHTHLYRTYYAEDQQVHLLDFSEGKIHCLITCHKVSQGIDIQSLKHVVLFSSARSKLETIQRIGRCLRVDPTNPAKRAIVIDFVRYGEETEKFESADEERCTWLTSVSQVKKGDDVAT